jgi:ribokinase
VPDRIGVTAGTVYSLGSILVDVTVDVPRLPERGGDVLATGTRTVPGGGFNLAVAVARQGVRCLYAAPHGTGPYGDLIRDALAAESILVTAKRRANGDSGFTVTLVEPDGERTFVTMAGVEAALEPDDLAGLSPAARDIVSVSGYDLAYPGSGPVLAGWLDTLPDGVRVALDPGPLIMEIPADRLSRVLGRIAILTLNQREARLLSGAAGASGADLLEAVRRSRFQSGAETASRAPARETASRAPAPETAHRPPAVDAARHPSALVVVREGPDGCVAAGGPLGDRVVAVTAPAVRAVDTTGAGDAHTGVLLASLAAGHDVEAALRTATRAATISVTRVGPATTPTAAEL